MVGKGLISLTCAVQGVKVSAECVKLDDVRRRCTSEGSDRVPCKTMGPRTLVS